MVGLNGQGFVHDFYYPYAGLENHASTRDLHHRIAIWVDGAVSWLDDDSWTMSVDYEPHTMIGKTVATCSSRALALEFHDFVDCEQNIFARNIHVVNNSNEARDIRVFMHQVFRIADSQRDDTAQFLPDPHAVMHYKGRRVFLVGGEHSDGRAFDQFAIGLHGIEGHEGTYKDAEDGELSGNLVEHGKVDSTIRFSFNIKGLSSERVHYWISASATRHDAIKQFKSMQKEGFVAREQATRQYWQDWLGIGSEQLHQLDPEFHPSVVKSLFIIKSHIDRRGAVIASGDSEMLNYARDYYSYCWPRDAVFALWPLLRLGYTKEVEAYFEFARDVMHADGYLMHKYQPDRAIGSSWHPYQHDTKDELPIQEDETALTLFLLGEYHKTHPKSDLVRGLYETMVQPMANFMGDYIDSDTKLPHASYDLWEQKFLTSTFTVGVVYAALAAAASLAEAFDFPDDAVRWNSVAEDIQEAARETLYNQDRGYLYKGYSLGRSGMLSYDPVVDTSSLFGAVMFGLYSLHDEYIKTSIDTLEATLVDKTPSGGLQRYEHDGYYATSNDSLGNPWLVTTLWFAQFLIEAGDPDRARDYLRWAQAQMLTSGALPEQLDPNSGSHISVEPLIWSQAEFINTALDLASIDHAS
jgi:GH15 family glucan-1,4-alpha-glucosidase